MGFVRWQWYTSKSLRLGARRGLGALALRHAGAVVLLVLVSWITVAGDAFASCARQCSVGARLTGLAYPPAWAAGRRIHFEAASLAASAYPPFPHERIAGHITPLLLEGSESESSEQLLFHEVGKGVQHTPKVYVIFWGSNFEETTSGKEVHSMLLKLYEGLTSTAYQGILTQYFDATGRASSTVIVTSYIDKSVKAPKTVNHSAVEKEVEKAIETNKWTSELTAQFDVITAPESTYESGFPGACAYHEYTSGGVIYGFIPYQGDPPFSTNGCIETGNPSKNPVKKTSKSASHEYAETVTDPHVDTWFSSSGAEIADICSNETDLELPDGAWAQNQFDDHLLACSHEDEKPPHAYAVTEAASSIVPSSATLNGTTNAEGTESHYFFEYGTTTSYGKTTVEATAGSGISNVKQSQNAPGLVASTTYHYRLVEKNSTGSTHGTDHTFTTTAGPIVETKKASAIIETGAKLNGTVNPNGSETKYYFEYGTTTSYGSKTAEASSGSGTSTLEEGKSLTALTANTIYHFRIVATNTFGTVDGSDRAFETNSVASAFQTTFGSLGSGNGQLKSPKGLVLDTKGDVVVADADNNRVEVFTVAGEFVRAFGSLGSGNGQLDEPKGVAVDSKNNIWVADTLNNRLEEFNEKGEFLKTVGSAGTGNGQVKEPKGLAIDSHNNVWVADTANNRIEEFNEKGEFLKTVGSAGSGNGQLKEPRAVIVPTNGTIWVADTGNSRVEEFNEKGEFTKTVGSAGTENGQFKEPKGVTIDTHGNIWVVDSENNRVQEFTETGEYEGKFGPTGQFSEPWGIAVTSSGVLFVSDGNNNRIQKWITPEESEPAAYVSQFGSAGSGNGQFKLPRAMVVNGGDLFIADEENNRVDVITEGGEFVKSMGSFGGGNGQLDDPKGTAVDSKGNIWVDDEENNRIEEFNEKGEFVKTVGSVGNGNGQLKEPKDVAVDSHSNVWVADSANNRIEEFNEKGEFVKTVGSAGSGAGQLKLPRGLAIDSSGDVWVADTSNNRVEEFDEKGEFLNTVGMAGSAPGEFKEPKGIAVDSHGAIWVADSENNRIQELNEKGEYELQFGSEGTGTGQFKEPWGIAINTSGEVFVADAMNDRIERWLK